LSVLSWVSVFIVVDVVVSRAVFDFVVVGVVSVALVVVVVWLAMSLLSWE
jgi:hypothetical protein